MCYSIPFKYQKEDIPSIVEETNEKDREYEGVFFFNLTVLSYVFNLLSRFLLCVYLSILDPNRRIYKEDKLEKIDTNSYRFIDVKGDIKNYIKTHPKNNIMTLLLILKHKRKNTQELKELPKEIILYICNHIK